MADTSRKDNAMKMFDKEKIEYKNGYLVCEGEIVSVDNEVVDLANKLETDVQRASFKRTHGCNYDPCKVCDEPFARTTERNIPTLRVETPMLDKKTKQAMQMMDEIDAMEKADQINEYLRGIDPLLQFAENDFVIACEHGEQHRFDVPVLGDPTKWTLKSISEQVMSIFDVIEVAGE